jgi:transposase
MANNEAKVEKSPVLNLAVKFEIKPTPEQLVTMQLVSNNLRQVWNLGLAERQEYFAGHIKPLLDERKKVPVDSSLKAKLTAASKAAPDHFKQCKSLTGWRHGDAAFAAVPCSWQQENLKILAGAYASFLQLRANGDVDARPPSIKADNAFCAIEGLSSWQLATDTISIKPQAPLDGVHHQAIGSAETVSIVFSPGKPLPGGVELRFELPEYQRLLLARAVKLCKFTLYRDKKKRYWVSIAYALDQPEQKELVPEDVVLVALGASHLSFLSPAGEEVIDLWRPDKHWMPKIEVLRERIKAAQKGSIAHRKRTAAMNRMYEIMRAQQLQNQRETVVRALRKHGVHFILIEHSPIRSKAGKLADRSNSERQGTLGSNWSVQNTGSLARLKQLLQQKAAEWGGTVSNIKLESYPAGDAREKKLAAARVARVQYLQAA